DRGIDELSNFDGLCQLDVIAKNACALIALTCSDQQLRFKNFPIVRRVVDRDDSLHVELEALDISEQVYGLRIDRRRSARKRLSRRIEPVRFEQHFFFGEIDQKHSIVVPK